MTGLEASRCALAAHTSCGNSQGWVVSNDEVGEELCGVLLCPRCDVLFGPVPLVDIASLGALVLHDATNYVVGFSWSWGHYTQGCSGVGTGERRWFEMSDRATQPRLGSVNSARCDIAG